MTTIYNVHAYKGGVGVTTTACALAVRLAKEGNKTLLVSDDESGDAPSWLGVPVGNGISPIAQNLDYVQGFFGNVADDYDSIVVDSGRNASRSYPQPHRVVNVVVVRNDYITLKNTLNKPYDVLVAFISEKSALNAQDVAQTLNAKTRGPEFIVANIDPAVARAVDAGLAMSRDHLFPWTEQIVGFARV